MSMSEERIKLLEGWFRFAAEEWSTAQVAENGFDPNQALKALRDAVEKGAEVRSLQAESNTFQQRLGNLLARIHRDGGHYISEHGWDKACAGADEKLVSGIVTISQENDSLKAENAKLLEIAKGMHEALRVNWLHQTINHVRRIDVTTCKCSGHRIAASWSIYEPELHTFDCPARPDALEGLL